jgi:hypothetical protein
LNPPGGQTQVLSVRQIKKIDRHPAKRDVDSSPDTISDTENWLNFNSEIDNPTDIEDHWEAGNASDMELDYSSEDSEMLEQ